MMSHSFLEMGSWNNRNIVNLLFNREIKAENAKKIKRHWQFTDSTIKRLGLEYELEGHQGCVNCLQWTEDGRYLASGSDDTNIIIWDPFKHKSIKKCPTPHIGNIFSVKFLGREGSLIASAAGDCRVIVQYLENADTSVAPHLDCRCHVGRVKRLAVAPEQPLLFWSAGEDGYVIQYDLREPHECPSQSTVFIDLCYSSEIKCIAVNPTKPHLVAIGADDCFIRMYDRRMVRMSAIKSSYTLEQMKRSTAAPQDPNCLYYAPGHLAKDSGGDISYKLAATYIAFNSAGSEMLVNMGGEQIYLFDVDNPRSINDIRVPQNFTGNHTRSPCNFCYSMGDVCSKESKANGSNCACTYNKRALKLFNRKWMGDLYSAARDYLHVIQHWPDNTEAYIGLIECLIALKWSKEAIDWHNYFTKQFPNVREDKLKRLREAASNLDVETEKKEDGGEEKTLTDEEKQLRLDARDYELRFLGHCNTTTDIKEVNFLGEDGRYICAGSDDAVIFIWDRKTTNVIHALVGDSSIVNCVQPHPSTCFIASSGIDTAVKLWSPLDEDGSVNTNLVTDLRKVIKLNQARMSMDPLETMLVHMGYRLRDSQFESGPLQELPTCRTS